MKVLRVQLGEFWCNVLDEDGDRFLVRDPIYYCLPKERRPRRPPKVWVYRYTCRKVTHGLRLK